MSDPVANKSTFLCMYMSNHPDTLVSYVRHWGKVNASVSSAKMTAISTKGMSLEYSTKGSDAKHKVWVEFNPPLSGYDEVKPRLLSMKVDAEEALGMSTAPQISEFRLPPSSLITGIAIGFLLYVVYAPERTAPNFHPMFSFGRTFREMLPSWAIPATYAVVAIVHSAETLYMYTLCRKHRTGLVTGAKYLATTAFFGFPVIGEMRGRIHSARIASITKGQ